MASCCARAITSGEGGPPFNGRLFSPAHAPLADTTALDDGAVSGVLLALTTRPARAGRQRIAYADLGVEQLGGVYERILDFEAAGTSADPSTLTLVRAGHRKTTGAFYTPRSLTEYVVRRALAPLVHDAGPDGILALRVLDPAMGSGAFLVAACRYLAVAYESALVRNGVVSCADLTDQDRSGFRRVVAQRCLFGVDINPMAVQLGRLSLWLATLAGDRPLTFLDHHLRTGNSLVGAALADVVRHPASGRRRRAASGGLPLFDLDAADDAIGGAIGPRLSIANDPGDTIEQVRAKERLMSSLHQDGTPLARWKAAADLWCAGWFMDPSAGRPPARDATFSALLDDILGRPAVLPSQIAAPLLHRVRALAERERFFHWTLEFPEVFHEADGRPRPGAGFDAVVGNPPWEMLRGDRGAGRDESAHLVAFTRGSGVYRLQGDGHANLYQLFLERAASLLREGGRLGLVLPSGFASDHGCAVLRRHFLDRTRIDTFTSVENRDGLFPIHRGVKFLLLTATTGGATTTILSRAGIRSPEALDESPDAGADPSAVPITRLLLDRLSGPQLAVPELRTADDVALVSRIAFSTPALGDPTGWNVAFGRELNATEDRGHFVDLRRAAAGRGHYPVIEGKQIQPFTVDLSTCRFHIPARTAATLIDPARTYARDRLAYRDVAAAGNRLTLIAAIVPARVLTTHTLFCIKSPVDEEVQQFLCGVFNSYVANYLVRLRVSTHVNVSIIERLPVPRPPRDSAAFREIVALSVRLAAAPGDAAAAARLQAAAARLYELTHAQFRHVLGTFPLISAADRARAAGVFEADDS
ncbi:MAG: N-6 DNA methylase [Acidobacteriota bacterium]